MSDYEIDADDLPIGADLESENATVLTRIDALDGILADCLGRRQVLEDLITDSSFEQFPAFMTSSYALLSAAEEIELAKFIEAGHSAVDRLAVLDSDDPARQALERDMRLGKLARDRFVLANIRLVAAHVRTTNGRGLEFADRMQVGLIGVMRAADKFDYRVGTKFSTYATWWIKQGIQRAVANESRTVRIPVHFHDQVVAVRAAEHRLTQELNRAPFDAELAAASGRTVEEVQLVQRLDRAFVSLEVVIDEVDSDVDRLGGRPDLDIEADLDRVALCKSMLAVLTDREAEVLKRRCGYVTGEEETLDEIGKSFGVTRERIRQIEAKAKTKILEHFAGAVA